MYMQNFYCLNYVHFQENLMEKSIDPGDQEWKIVGKKYVPVMTVKYID